LVAADFHSSDLVVVYSDSMADLVQQRYGIPPERIRKVALGVCASAGINAVDGSSAHVTWTEKFRIGYAGRLVSFHKGCDLLPELARLLLDDGFADFECVVVGDGPDRAAVEARCRELCVSECFSFLGWREDVEAWMSSFDVLVVPSRLEPFGMVMAEALCMGVRVVAFDVGGLREASAGCPEAVLVRPGDVHALARAVSDILRTNGKSRSPAARNTIRETFSVDRMARETESVYRQAFAGRARAERRPTEK
jgi:glycosyltransferase involved in cell wall biosynthesis